MSYSLYYNPAESSRVAKILPGARLGARSTSRSGLPAWDASDSNGCLRGFGAAAAGPRRTQQRSLGCGSAALCSSCLCGFLGVFRFVSRCASRCRGFASPTPEGFSLNSRGRARRERTPGKGARKARHPGGVIPFAGLVDGLVPGEFLRGSWVPRRESGGVARASRHPRLFTVNPAGVRPCEARGKWISPWLRRSRLAMMLPGMEAIYTVQMARTYAKIDLNTATVCVPLRLSTPSSARPSGRASSSASQVRPRGKVMTESHSP